jgi:hypothetical protein
VPFGKLQVGCHVPFTEEWLPFGHYHKGLIGGMLQEMVVLLEGSPIYTEELWSSVRVTIGLLVTWMFSTNILN